MNEQTYLTTDELSSRIKYDVRTIRERLKDSVLMEECTMCDRSVAERSCLCGRPLNVT